MNEMTPPQESWEERFDDKFKNMDMGLGARFETYAAYREVKAFIATELDRAVKAAEERAYEKAIGVLEKKYPNSPAREKVVAAIRSLKQGGKG